MKNAKKICLVLALVLMIGCFASCSGSKGSVKIETADDLIGKTIGVQLGTTGDIVIAGEIEGATVKQYAKAVDALSSVGVEAPEGNSLCTCDSGKKTGKRRYPVIIFDDKSAVFKMIVAHGLSFSQRLLLGYYLLYTHNTSKAVFHFQGDYFSLGYIFFDFCVFHVENSFIPSHYKVYFR